MPGSFRRTSWSSCLAQVPSAAKCARVAACAHGSISAQCFLISSCPKRLVRWASRRREVKACDLPPLLLCICRRSLLRPQFPAQPAIVAWLKHSRVSCGFLVAERPTPPQCWAFCRGNAAGRVQAAVQTGMFAVAACRCFRSVAASCAAGFCRNALGFS